jgi:hypothetical protein
LVRCTIGRSLRKPPLVICERDSPIDVFHRHRRSARTASLLRSSEGVARPGSCRAGSARPGSCRAVQPF